MNIQITCDRYPLTDRTRLLIDTKLAQKIDRLLSNFDNDAKDAKILIQRNKFRIFNVTFDMDLPGPGRIHATSQHLLLRSAVIHLEHQITKQLEKYRSSITGNR